MIASALEKLPNTHVHFRKRVSVEEQRAQKYDRFLRGRQIAYMIYEHFGATGAYEALQGLSDLFTTRLQNHHVQDFDVRRDQALFSASEIPTDVILEGLYKFKLQDSVQLQILLALYDQETVRKKRQTSYSRLKTSVRLHIDQMMRTRNFRIWNKVVERGEVTKSQKGTEKPTLRGKWENVFSGNQMDNVQMLTHVVFSHGLASGNRGEGERRRGQSSSPAPNSKAKTDGEGEKPQQNQAAEMKALQTRGAEFRADTEIVIIRRVKIRHPPVCQNYKSKTRCRLGNNTHFRHVEAKEKPSKKSKKGGAKGSVALLKESIHLGWVSQDSYPR